MSKDELITDYVNYYNDNEQRVTLCKHILNKHRFERYSMKDNNINDEDYIIKGNLRSYIELIINKSICSKEQLGQILDKISYDDLSYIGI